MCRVIDFGGNKFLKIALVEKGKSPTLISMRSMVMDVITVARCSADGENYVAEGTAQYIQEAVMWLFPFFATL